MLSTHPRRRNPTARHKEKPGRDPSQYRPYRPSPPLVLETSSSSSSSSSVEDPLILAAGRPCPLLPPSTLACHCLESFNFDFKPVKSFKVGWSRFDWYRLAGSAHVAPDLATARLEGHGCSDKSRTEPLHSSSVPEYLDTCTWK